MMELLEPLRESWPKFIPFLFSFAMVAVALWLADWFLLRRRKELGEEGTRLQARIDTLQRRVDFINGMLKSTKADPEKT